MQKDTTSKDTTSNGTTSINTMTKVIDVFGEYEPTIRCTCIDERTLTNINHSLRILHSDKMREQKELKEINSPSPLENDAMNINDLVMRRTKSLMETLKEIKPCKDIKISRPAEIHIKKG